MKLSESEDLQTRLLETEIKLAFMEKEMGEYRDAVNTLHARLEAAERALRRLQDSAAGKSGEAGIPEDPFAS